MIASLRNDLLAKALELLTEVIPGDNISPEFDAYITDTAIAIRYSGVIPALLDNESPGKAVKSGLSPSLVNRLLVKLLRKVFGYPDSFQYGTIKDICVHPPSASVLKDQMLEILASLKFAAKTYRQSESFSYATPPEAYKSLDRECHLNVENFRENRDPIINQGRNANLRLAYYSYRETGKGYQSWFDSYDLKVINDNIDNHLPTYKNTFRIAEDKLPIPDGGKLVSFELVVGSRGLLIGTGYPHMNIMNEDKHSDFQLGLFFDHSTGIPVIPASSIKGFLKASFPTIDDDEDDIREFVGQMNIASDSQKPTLQCLQRLQNTIFGDESNTSHNSIFFNAYITKAVKLSYDVINPTRKYIDEDWLAPHMHNGKHSRLREPSPIRFLKILPGVVFKFSFVVEPVKINDNTTVTAQHIEALFKAIFLSRNFGAKHRTGFGSFMEVNSNI